MGVDEYNAMFRPVPGSVPREPERIQISKKPPAIKCGRPSVSGQEGRWAKLTVYLTNAEYARLKKLSRGNMSRFLVALLHAEFDRRDGKNIVKPT